MRKQDISTSTAKPAQSRSARQRTSVLQCLSVSSQKILPQKRKYFLWLGMRDSNPRMLGPEPSALPLGESPTHKDGILSERRRELRFAKQNFPKELRKAPRPPHYTTNFQKTKIFTPRKPKPPHPSRKPHKNSIQATPEPANIFKPRKSPSKPISHTPKPVQNRLTFL